ncbi:TPR repeat protein [Halenospora varia]|nr:TPR repeat protein [Halenospora varia]
MAARLRVEDYTVGWICTTHVELAAASEMLDEEHESLPQTPNDPNIYTFGRCGSHCVVIACLPAGQRGTSSAATVASQMKSTFTSLRFGLLVGIGGGVPTTDIRLGDVVVSQQDSQFGGVVQYDTGERQADGRFLRTGLLNMPPTVLLAALQKLKSNHQRGINKCAEYLNIICGKEGLGFARPEGKDLLFQAGYKHIGGHHCKDCGMDGLVARESREQMVVHYGTIASGNLDVRDSETRQQLSDDLGGVLCLENEAAGLMNSFPCVVIRGICDYADSHKNEMWHKYAAAIAAAYAKDLLTVIPALEVENTRTIGEIIYAEKVKSLQMIPFPRNEDVVIREGIFSELEKKLPITTRYQSAVLWGLGGSGKTQVALEFAYRRYDATPCSIFWLSDKLENEDLMDAVRDWIETQSNWLLVLDNADALHHFGEQFASHNHDNSRNLYSFIPRGPTGTILWTTRDGRIVGDLISSKQGINVGSMDTLEARELLVGLSDSVITDNDTLVIAAYIRRTSTTIQDYVKKLKKEKRRWKLLEESKFDRHRRPNVPNSVMKTWQISIDYIREENPYAYTILHVIAYFNNQNIPFELIKATVRSKDRQEDNKDKQDDDVDTEGNESEDDDDVVEAATRLNEFSFLRLRNSKSGLRSYEMHKLVQEATRYAIGKKESERFSKSALEIMLEVFPTSNPDTWDRCEVYLPHALTVSNCLEISQEKIGVSDLLCKVSGYLHTQLRPREKEPVDLKALKLRKEALGERHPDTIRSIANLASTYHQQGRLKEAEEIQVQVMNVFNPSSASVISAYPVTTLMNRSDSLCISNFSELRTTIPRCHRTLTSLIKMGLYCLATTATGCPTHSLLECNAEEHCYFCFEDWQIGDGMVRLLTASRKIKVKTKNKSQGQINPEP